MSGLKDFAPDVQSRLHGGLLGDRRAGVLEHINVDEFGMDVLLADSVEDILTMGPNHALRDLSDYVGVYGHFGYGNLTILMNGTSGQLDMEYGCKEQIIILYVPILLQLKMCKHVCYLGQVELFWDSCSRKLGFIGKNRNIY